MRQVIFRKSRPHLSGLTIALLISGLTLAACTTGGQLVKEQLDPRTGVTATRSTVPLVFYLDSSSRDSYSRDFVDIGPLKINRMGEHRYYIWLGIWSTIRGRDVSAEINRFETITIFADGVPIQLPVHGLTLESINASKPVYPQPASSGVEAYYEITMDQLRIIASASEIRFSAAASQDAAYLPWDDQARALESFRAFLDYDSY